MFKGQCTKEGGGEEVEVLKGGALGRLGQLLVGGTHHLLAQLKEDVLDGSVLVPLVEQCKLHRAIALVHAAHVNLRREADVRRTPRVVFVTHEAEIVNAALVHSLAKHRDECTCRGGPQIGKVHKDVRLVGR